jgi:hypothetical protein
MHYIWEEHYTVHCSSFSFSISISSSSRSVEGGVKLLLVGFIGSSSSFSSCSACAFWFNESTISSKQGFL